MIEVVSDLQVVVSAEAIQARIEGLASEIISDYTGRSPLFVCLLRGGVPFASRLMLEITAQAPDFYPQLEYMQAKTYGTAREAAEPTITTGLADDVEVAGRTLVVLDDVLDTGKTPAFVEQYLRDLGAAKVDLIVLAQKDKDRQYWPAATKFGFTVPDKWLVGMGCDTTSVAPEAYRWADALFVVED